MATDRALRKALLKKLGVQPPALSKRVQRKKLLVPMSTEEATYLIAHEVGIKIDKYLDPEQVIRIRDLHNSLARSSGPPSQKAETSKGRTRHHLELRFPGDFRVSDVLLARSKVNEAVAMARVFPLLYVLENSLRELIRRVLSSKFGHDWWDTQLKRGKLKGVHAKAAERTRTEKKNSWHQRRGSHPIDYVDIKDLESLVLAKQACFFPDIIPDRAWFEQFMRELYPSRNVVCHMNPLDSDNIRDIGLRLRKWEKLIKASAQNIPEEVTQ